MGNVSGKISSYYFYERLAVAFDRLKPIYDRLISSYERSEVSYDHLSTNMIRF